jgi:hypothetical protein
MSKRFFWDGEKGILVKEGRPICKVVGKNNQWLLEYNPLPPDTTSQPPTTYPTTLSVSPEHISNSTQDTSESTDDTTDQHTQQPFTEKSPKESPPKDLVTVKFLSSPYMIGTPQYVESDTSDSESESENFPQKPILDAIEAEEELEEIDKSFDLSVTEPPHILPMPDPDTGLEIEEIDESFDLSVTHVLPTPEPTPEWDERIPPTSTQTTQSNEETYKTRLEITSNIDPANIIEGGRTRSRRAAHLNDLNELHASKEEIQRHCDETPSSWPWDKVREHPLRDINDRIT